MDDYKPAFKRWRQEDQEEKMRSSRLSWLKSECRVNLHYKVCSVSTRVIGQMGGGILKQMVPRRNFIQIIGRQPTGPSVFFSLTLALQVVRPGKCPSRTIKRTATSPGYVWLQPGTLREENFSWQNASITWPRACVRVNFHLLTEGGGPAHCGRYHALHGQAWDK